jgi:hypothetical protein
LYILLECREIGDGHAPHIAIGLLAEDNSHPGGLLVIDTEQKDVEIVLQNGPLLLLGRAGEIEQVVGVARQVITAGQHDIRGRSGFFVSGPNRNRPPG